jgi:cobalt-zinc-cadmium efflux system membrane fusion protein
MKKIISAILALLTMACFNRKNNDIEPEAPINEIHLSHSQVRNAGIEIIAVEIQPVRETLKATGQMGFDDRLVTRVFSPVGGRVTRLIAEQGEHVKTGQPLATIDSPELGKLLAEVTKAEAAYLVAHSEHIRQKELFEAGAGTKADYEAAAATWKSSKAEFDSIRKVIDYLSASDADRISQEYVLRTPISGEIISRSANPGVELQGQLNGGEAAELFVVGDLDRLYFIIDLFEMDLFKVKTGDLVKIHIAGYPDGPISTKVDWISGALDPESRTSKVRCIVPNNKRLLRPGMFAKAVIQVEAEMSLAIPRDSLVRIGNNNFVFVCLGQNDAKIFRFERRPVQVEENQAGTFLPIKSGLQKGEQIVSKGAIQLAGAF